jgi:DNA polymerase-3 subunit delta
VKLAAGRVEGFVRRPNPEIRAVLLYGPDAGLARERADTLAREVCPDLRDPFRVADLPAAALAGDPARLADEAAQIGLMGGRRVVRVREAGDALAPLFARFLADTVGAMGGPAGGDSLVLAEAGDLPGRSALRRAFDESPDAAAIGCYPDSARDLAAVIRDAFAARRIRVSRDASDFLVEHLGDNRLVTRAELEKLTLYAGDGGHIDIDEARAVIADSAALSLDDAVLAAAEGNCPALDRALTRVFQEGGSPVTVIRALLRHLQRLHLLAARIAGGGSVDETIRAARPPIFFKEQDSYRRQLRHWREARLRRALERVNEAEFRMKLTGLPADTICREAMFALAREARADRDPV